MDAPSSPRVVRQILALVLAGRCFTDVQVRAGEPLAVRGPRGYSASDGGVLDGEDLDAFAAWIDPRWQARLLAGGGHFDAALTLGEH